jgi:hypothetical protein
MKSHNLKAVILEDEQGAEKRVNFNFDDLRQVEQLDCSDYEIILQALAAADLTRFCSTNAAVDLIAKLKPMRDRVCRV